MATTISFRVNASAIQTITISDAFAARLAAKYGTLKEFLVSCLKRGRAEFIANEMGPVANTERETQAAEAEANIQLAIDAKETELGTVT